MKTMTAVLFDEFYVECPYFTRNTRILGGYGCLHPAADMEYDASAGKKIGECMCSACPCGFSAEDEDLKNQNIDWDTWAYGSEGEVAEDEFIILDRREKGNEKAVSRWLETQMMHDGEQQSGISQPST